MRGDGAGEDVDGDWPPPDESSVGDDDGDDFPLPEASVPAEQLRQSPRLVPPKFRLVVAESRPESLLMIFFLGRKTSYSRRWAPEGHQGAHEAGGTPPPSWLGCGPPLVFSSLSIFY